MMMPMGKALYILSQTHTRDDNVTGFTVQFQPEIFEWSRADYIEAWRAVRYNIGMQVGPEGKADGTA